MRTELVWKGKYDEYGNRREEVTHRKALRDAWTSGGNSHANRRGNGPAVTARPTRSAAGARGRPGPGESPAGKIF